MIAVAVRGTALRDSPGPLARLSASISRKGAHWRSLPPGDRVLAAIANPVPHPSADERGLAPEAPAQLIHLRCRLADLVILHTNDMGMA
jgi:hypothetical protein